MNFKTLKFSFINKFFRLIFILILIVSCNENIQSKNVIKILAIGNSFSADAIEQNLYELIKAKGDSIVIGNAYIGGCSLRQHLDNSVNNSNTYQFRKIIGGEKSVQLNVTLKQCITDEKWDIITFQQASKFAGIDTTYKPLSDLIRFVRLNSTNPKVKFAIHQVWAYQQNSTHEGFRNYSSNQIQMYQSIVSAVKNNAKKFGIKRIIPSGCVIQNGRTTKIGDNFCRDGYHLNEYGKYSAACVWYEFLTKKNVLGNSYCPKSISPEYCRILQQAAHKAILHPEKITEIK